MNALVEDQLRRLRATLDSDQTREWLDLNRADNRITFGRYTGATPVPGEITPHKLERLREELRETENSGQGLNAEVRTHFPRLDGGEMWSRWDMQETPPDIFITNYSMLNIALMRSLENPIWEQTRSFLHSGDPEERVFFLILDELHAYRGTPGTEVAYLLRLLLYRLGLTPESPQLRILTTTASLEDEESGRRFLREFWGRDRFAFFSTPQIPPSPDAAQSLFSHADAFAHFARSVQIDPTLGAPKLEGESVAQLAREVGFMETGGAPAEALSRVLEWAGAAEALRGACQEVSPDGTIRPASAPSLAQALWPDFRERDDAMRGLLLGLGMAKGDDGRSPQPTRGHLFYHNLGGMWACLDPNCSHVETSHRAEREAVPVWGQPTIGALHPTHRLACDCGARVLDFIACEVCGDAFVGGYRSQKRDGSPHAIAQFGSRNAHITLTTDQPDLDTCLTASMFANNTNNTRFFGPNLMTKQPNPASRVGISLLLKVAPL